MNGGNDVNKDIVIDALTATLRDLGWAVRATKSGRKKEKVKKRKGTFRGETPLKKADPQKETSRENEMIRCEGIVYGDGGEKRESIN